MRLVATAPYASSPSRPSRTWITRTCRRTRWPTQKDDGRPVCDRRRGRPSFCDGLRRHPLSEGQFARGDALGPPKRWADGTPTQGRARRPSSRQMGLGTWPPLAAHASFRRECPRSSNARSSASRDVVVVETGPKSIHRCGLTSFTRRESRTRRPDELAAPDHGQARRARFGRRGSLPQARPRG